MANVANVKVKQGNILVLSGSSVELSGSGANSAVKVSGDMTVSGTLRADKMEITDVTYVTSSVLYRDGSTKFGNDASDNHQFTGSVLINGNATATQFNGSGAGLTNIPNGALDNSSITVGSTSISLGDTATTVTGLVSVTSTGFTGSLNGNADSATALATARAINGTNFDGTGDITTANWGTARDITIGGTTRSVNGSANYSWSLSDIGAAGTGSANTFTGVNTFTNASNVFTGSISGSQAEFSTVTAETLNGTLAASNLSGQVSLANGGTGADLSAASTGADAFVMVREGTALVAYEITSSDGTVVVAGNASTDKIDLTVSPSVGTGTVTSITPGAGLENSGSAITVSGEIIVKASTGINVSSAGVAVDESVVLTTSGTGPYVMSAAVSSSAGLSGSVGNFGTLNAASADVAGALTVGHIETDSTSDVNIFAGRVDLNHALQMKTITVSSSPHSADDEIVILAQGGETVTLPNPSGLAGRYYVVKNRTAGTSGVTVNTSAGNIDGDSSFVLYGPYQSITVVTDGSNWFVL